MVRAVEAWLKSDDPERFAEAAIKCEHAGGFCMEDGYCHLDGACFRTDRSAMTAARRAIQLAAENEPQDIANNMRLASELLRQSWEAANVTAANDHG